MKSILLFVAKLILIIASPLLLGFAGILLAAGWTYLNLPPEGAAADANAGFTFAGFSMIFGLLGFLVGVFLSFKIADKWLDDPSGRTMSAAPAGEKP